MTVLLYIPRIDAASGGLGMFVQTISEALGRLCQLHVVTHRGIDDLPLSSCTVHYLSHTPFQMHWQFRHLLTRLQPDICHVNGCWTPQCSWVTRWCKSSGIPVVYSPHGMLEPYAIHRHYWTRKLPALLLYQRRSIRRSDCIHVTSEMEAKNIQALGWNKHTYIVPNCIQLSQIPLRTDWQSTKRILFMSRIHPKKGIHILIEAVGRLKQELGEYECLIVGPSEGDYLQQLRRLTADLGLADLVRFSAPVYGKKKWNLFHSSDVFVLPTMSENFGIVVAEALATGTPVITTQGSPWQELNERKCGYWIPTGTDALTKAIQQFLALSEENRRQMGLKGRHLVEERYTDEAVAQQMLNLYLQILKK